MRVVILSWMRSEFGLERFESMIPEEKRAAVLARRLTALVTGIPGLDFRGFSPVLPETIQPIAAWKQVAQMDLPEIASIECGASFQSLCSWFLESIGMASPDLEVCLSVGGFGSLPWCRFHLTDGLEALPKFWLSTESQEVLVLLPQAGIVAGITCEEYAWELRKIPAGI